MLPQGFGEKIPPKVLRQESSRSKRQHRNWHVTLKCLTPNASGSAFSLGDARQSESPINTVSFFLIHAEEQVWTWCILLQQEFPRPWITGNQKKTLIRDVRLRAAELEHLENELARQICANEVLHEVVNPEIVPDSKPWSTCSRYSSTFTLRWHFQCVEKEKDPRAKRFRVFVLCFCDW